MKIWKSIVSLITQKTIKCERVGNQFLSHLAWESKLGQAVSWQSTFIAHHSSVVGKVVQLCPRGWGSIQSRLRGVGMKCQKWHFPPTLMILICIVILVQTHGVTTMCLGGCLGCPSPGRCCLTHEAVWSVSGLVTSFSLS